MNKILKITTNGEKNVLRFWLGGEYKCIFSPVRWGKFVKKYGGECEFQFTPASQAVAVAFAGKLAATAVAAAEASGLVC